MPRRAGPVAALVAVGNELLLGETVDTNAAWLGRWLAALGIPVVHKETVGDVEKDITASVRAAAQRADLVVVCGGLGPTPDDLTKEAVAALLGLDLVLDEPLLERLRERFRIRGYTRLPSTNHSQAEVPRGATVLRNDHGTAPGLLMQAGECAIVLLPGVPREMRGICEGDLADALRARFEGRLAPVRHHLIRTTGVAESRLSELVEAALPDDMGPLTLAFLPDLRGVDLRLTATGVQAEEAEGWFARLEEALGPVVAPWRFEASGGDVTEALMEALLAADKRVAVAESCTGGLVAKRLTDLPGSSRVFLGGVVAYANEVKTRWLGVSPEDLEREGAVSEPVARQMALGVAERFGAEAGIGVTGVAGPGGGTPDKPVGTVWVSVALDGEAHAHRLGVAGDRADIRERSAQDALASLLRLLEAAG